MTPIVTAFRRHQVQQMLEFRQRGWSYAAVAEALGRDRGTIARYERVYDKFGIQAFAK